VIRRWERLLLDAAMLLAGATGLICAWMRYCMKPADPFSVVSHPWQPAMIAAHVLAAPLLPVAFGLILREHVLNRYGDPRARKARGSGLLLAISVAIVAASGYVVQVLTSSGSRRRVGLVHLAAGLLLLAAYGMHRAMPGRRAGAEASDAPGGARRAGETGTEKGRPGAPARAN
jgi:hypothetical protein